MSGRDPYETRSARLAQDRSRERRQRLLEAAISLLVTEGRGSITHRAVAKAADVSMSSVGYYFPSIDDLVTEAVTAYLDTWRIAFDELASTPGSTLEDVVSRLGVALGDGSNEDRLRAWQVYIQAVREPATADALSGVITSIRAALEHVVSELDLDKRLPDILMVAITGTSLLALGRKESSEQMIEALVSSIGYYVDISDPAAKSIRVTLESFDDGRDGGAPAP